MEKIKIPTITNKNFLESYVRQFALAKGMINQIGNSFVHFNSIEVFKKFGLIQKRRTLKFEDNVYLLKLICKLKEEPLKKNKEKYDNKSQERTIITNKNTFKRIINLRKKIEPSQTLREEYKTLIKSISEKRDKNKKKFLTNLDNNILDSLFKDKENSSINKSIKTTKKKSHIRNNINLINDKIKSISFYNKLKSIPLSSRNLDNFLKRRNAFVLPAKITRAKSSLVSPSESPKILQINEDNFLDNSLIKNKKKSKLNQESKMRYSSCINSSRNVSQIKANDIISELSPNIESSKFLKFIDFCRQKDFKKIHSSKQVDKICLRLLKK